MTTAVLLVLLGAFSRLIPHPPNFSALGALALYSGARLRGAWAFIVPLAAMAVSDLVLDWGSGREVATPMRAAIYGSFALIVLVGRAGARRERAARWVGFSLTASSLFYLVTNFAVWASGRLYPRTPAGLALCYVAALPWFWNTIAGDLVGTGVFFGADALARRRRAARASAAVFVGALFLSAAARANAQTLPFSENVVVTATAVPEEKEEVGSAATVITRQDIERNGWRTVSDALRSVPGVTVAQSGGPGAQTSVFLRGSASTQTLVLVDGVRVNSPFFPGYDFALFSTEDVERIEVVRGPFSALYGSEAIGGVVQIFTRAATQKLSARASAEIGKAGDHEETAFVSAGSGDAGVAASFRDRRADGDRENDDWRERSASLRFEKRFADRLTLALEGALKDGELGLAGPVGRETPRDRYFPREARIILPATFHPIEGHTATVTAGWTDSRPSFQTPGFRSDTDAQTYQARATDSFVVGAHQLTAFAGWQRWNVDDRSNFGVNLDGSRATLWDAGAEDTVRFGPAMLTAGVRYDYHSTFGRAWSPRATLTWRAGDWKLRASGGSGFRAPTVGELFYPFSGNPNLQPERSVSYDVGAEWRGKTARAEVSLFWNDYRDLIVYDFVLNENVNVGRARTRGVELTGRADVEASLAIDGGYTYLDPQDLGTGLPLIRRPRHSAFLGLAIRPVAALEIAPRAVFVGRRADFDALSGARTEDPGYVRLDLFARYTLGELVPYARVQNLLDRRYAEVNGFPSLRRRYAVGLEWRI